MNEEMDLHDLQGPNDRPAEDRTTEPPTNVAGGPLLEPHDGGCRCWPHVAQSDALRAVEHAALMEYRSPLAEAAQGKGERAAQSHNSGHRHVWRCDYCEALPEGAQGAAPRAEGLVEQLRQAINKTDVFSYDTNHDAYSLAEEIARYLAAPLAVDALANIIRQEDGDHSLGAGALAERILARWVAAPRADEIRWHYHGDCPHNGEVEGAAPRGNAERAEGLDVAAEVAYEMKVFLHGAKSAPPVAPGWLSQIEKWRARLSRPSDEEETQRVQERPVCKRFRHDEHCIDEPHG